jgi:hypothetical protein
MPNGRCRMHGGPSRGAKGNKNASRIGTDDVVTSIERQLVGPAAFMIGVQRSISRLTKAASACWPRSPLPGSTLPRSSKRLRVSSSSSALSSASGHRKKPLIARTLQAEQKRVVCQQLRNRRLYVGGSRYEVGQIFLSLWYTA